MEWDIIAKLQRAYDSSTMSNNRFGKALEAIKWDHKFQADGETYYQAGGLTVTVQNPDPFKELWKPAYMWDNMHHEF